MGDGRLRAGEVPEVRFAKASGSTIAYQVVGDGPVTITSVPPMAQNIEMAWEWPAIRRMFEQFASFSRFVMFDKRGTGMSDRSLDIPGLDERVDELAAVLDHAGIERTYLMGTSEGGPMTLMFAATFPERVDGVILEATAATILTDEERAMVMDGTLPPDRAARRRRFADAWGTPESMVVDLFAPSLAGDDEYRLWHQRYERNCASRDSILALFDHSGEMDARGVLHRISAPVLMINRVDDPVASIELARETYGLLRSHGVDVEMIEQGGRDHFVYATDLEPTLTAIERFTTGTVGDRPSAVVQHQRVIRAMGEFVVEADGDAVPTGEWGSRRARTLLKRLVVARGWPVTRDELAELLWPDGGDPARLGARLSVQLSAVRRVLHGGVVADRSSVRLDVDVVDVDVERWFALTDDGAIVEGYTGELLPDDRYDDYTAALRDEMRSRFVAAARRLADSLAAADAFDETVAVLRRVLVDDPYDESIHLRLISTLAALGRHGEAHTAYAAYVGAMDDLDVPARPWDRAIERP